MICYRITKSRYASDLSGRGAEIYGGRWNSPGYPVLYTAENRALALLEVLVHLPYGIIPADLVFITLEINIDREDCHIPEELPTGWNDIPPGELSRTIGNKWLSEKKSLGLIVPSVIVHGEYNLLFNPLHPDFSEMKIIGTKPLTIDGRLKYSMES